MDVLDALVIQECESAATAAGPDKASEIKDDFPMIKPVKFTLPLYALLTFLSALVACSSESAIPCVSDRECPDSLVCLGTDEFYVNGQCAAEGKACVSLCESDTQCQTANEAQCVAAACSPFKYCSED